MCRWICQCKNLRFRSKVTTNAQKFNKLFFYFLESCELFISLIAHIEHSLAGLLRRFPVFLCHQITRSLDEIIDIISSQAFS